MIPLIWIRVLLASAILALIIGLGYTGYSKIKQIGYQEAVVKYDKEITRYQDLVDKKITAIEISSTKLVELSRANNATLSTSVSKVTSQLKGKTLTIIKNNECYPNKTFSDSFGTLNSTVNQNMQESRK